jgi:hypothetical protein
MYSNDEVGLANPTADTYSADLVFLVPILICCSCPVHLHIVLLLVEWAFRAQLSLFPENVWLIFQRLLERILEPFILSEAVTVSLSTLHWTVQVVNKVKTTFFYQPSLLTTHIYPKKYQLLLNLSSWYNNIKKQNHIFQNQLIPYL